MSQRFRPDPSHRDLGYSPHDDDRGRYAAGLQRDDYQRLPEGHDIARRYPDRDGGEVETGDVDARGRSGASEAVGRAHGPVYGVSGASSAQDYWRGARQWQPAASEGPHRGHGPKGYTRTDARLHEAVCDRLTDDPDIDARNITVTVKDGVVTLEGRVDNRLSKHIIEDLVDDCGGVKGIRNLIDVGARAGTPGGA
jgi:osmotically-inducible protein OsmY